MGTGHCDLQVSVVVPFRGQGPLLAQACRSLLAQSLPCWEGLLVADGDDPEALAVARHYCDLDNRFRLLQVAEQDHAPGPWLARNLGIAAARAPLIAFLDADDLWHPAKLERQLPLHAAGGADLSVTGYHRFRHRDRRILETRIPPPRLSFRRLLGGNSLPLASVVIRRGLLLGPSGVRAFRAERHEDYGLWLRLFKHNPWIRYACIAEPLMAYRLHPGSLSAQRSHSVLAVERLFREHQPGVAARLLLSGNWLLRRLLEAAGVKLGALRRGQPRLDASFGDTLCLTPPATPSDSPSQSPPGRSSSPGCS